MSQQQNLATVKEIYDAVGTGDIDAILDRITDEVDWAAEAAGTGAPWHGPRTGKAEVASFLADLGSNIEISELTPRRFAADRPTSTCSSIGRSDRSPPATKRR
jgi:hypothetical protein